MTARAKLKAAFEAFNKLRAQGGRADVAPTFAKMVDGYNAYGGHTVFPARLDAERAASHAVVTFGRTNFLLGRGSVLNVLTAIAQRDLRIAELEIELNRERALRSNSWPTTHEADCPAVADGECRCPMANL